MAQTRHDRRSVGRGGTRRDQADAPIDDSLHRAATVVSLGLITCAAGVLVAARTSMAALVLTMFVVGGVVMAAGLDLRRACGRRSREGSPDEPAGPDRDRVEVPDATAMGGPAR